MNATYTVYRFYYREILYQILVLVRVPGCIHFLVHVLLLITW